MMLAVLYLLATLDGTLLGHHVAIGKNPLINKGDYWKRAVLRGLLVSQASLLLIALTAGLAFQLTSDRAALLASCLLSAKAMLAPFTLYALMIVAGLSLYITRWRILGNVLLLGPFTLLRAPVLALGCIAGAIAQPRVEILAILSVALLSTLGVKPLLRSMVADWSPADKSQTHS